MLHKLQFVDKGISAHGCYMKDEVCLDMQKFVWTCRMHLWWQQSSVKVFEVEGIVFIGRKSHCLGFLTDRQRCFAVGFAIMLGQEKILLYNQGFVRKNY